MQITQYATELCVTELCELMQSFLNLNSILSSEV